MERSESQDSQYHATVWLRKGSQGPEAALGRRSGNPRFTCRGQNKGFPETSVSSFRSLGIYGLSWQNGFVNVTEVKNHEMGEDHGVCKWGFEKRRVPEM